MKSGPKVPASLAGKTVVTGWLEPVVDKDAVPIPKGWRILARPLNVPTKSAGGIEFPDIIMRRAEYLRSVALVIAMGPLCYKDEGKFGPDAQPFCKIGDWVQHDPYVGVGIEVNGQQFKWLNDDQILGIMPKPEAIKFYF